MGSGVSEQVSTPISRSDTLPSKLLLSPAQPRLGGSLAKELGGADALGGAVLCHHELVFDITEQGVSIPPPRGWR